MNRERKNIEKAKNIALVASVILGMICCSTSVYARQSKRNESISFYGEKKYSNVLNSSFGDGEESIIGTDDREMIANTKKAPYKYIGKLEVGYESGKSDEGTGFLVGKSLVLTAAHCVYFLQKISEWKKNHDIISYHHNPINRIQNFTLVLTQYIFYTLILLFSNS